MPRLINREQKQEWLRSPVTEAFFIAVQNRVTEAAEQVLGSSDPDFDRFVKGMIHAYREILDMEIEVTDTDDADTPKE